MIFVSSVATAIASTSSWKPARPLVPPDVTAEVNPAGQIPWETPVVVRVRNGRLVSVAATDGSGAPLPGTFEQRASTWRSTAPLVPDTTYAVTAQVMDLLGHTRERTLVLKTSAPRQWVVGTITPGDGDVVGVGMPVVIRFDHAISNASRAVIAPRLSINTVPAVVGAWRWVSATEVHWRPQTYWPAHTAATATVDLTHLNLGDGAWGLDRHVSAFHVGNANISTADAATHMMTVTSNGKVLRSIPMSAGREEYPSRSGVHIALSKDRTITMDSSTVGIPRNSPNGYFEKVDWDVRISYSGEFVHAAPWSVADQGQRNVSHGCINLSPADAQWFYGLTQRGDVIDVRNAGSPPNLADPGTADWNLSWEAWSR